MNLSKSAAMTMNNMKEKIEQVVSDQPSQWQKDAAFRNENKRWLKRSQAVALKVLVTLRANNWSQKDLAEKMGVSAQSVNKWIKGNENFTFETISKLEDALNIRLMSVAGMENKETVNNQTIVIQVSKQSNENSTHLKQSYCEKKIIPLNQNFSIWGNNKTWVM
jgi:ribosome-binding protein aMBF1 (putative translation factor)